MIPQPLLKELYNDIKDLTKSISKNTLYFMNSLDIRWLELPAIHYEAVRYIVYFNSGKIIILKGIFVRERELPSTGDNYYRWQYYPDSSYSHDWVGTTYRSDISNEYLEAWEKVAEFCGVSIIDLIECP